VTGGTTTVRAWVGRSTAPPGLWRSQRWAPASCHVSAGTAAAAVAALGSPSLRSLTISGNAVGDDAHGPRPSDHLTLRSVVLGFVTVLRTFSVIFLFPTLLFFLPSVVS